MNKNKKRKIPKKWILVWIIFLLFVFIILLPYIPLPFGLKIRLITTNGMSHKYLPNYPFNKTIFDIFWKEHLNITNIPFDNGFDTGDFVLISKIDREYSVGDVVSYPYDPPVNFKIHRVSEYNGTHLTTLPDRFFKGGAELLEDSWFAKCRDLLLMFENSSVTTETLEARECGDLFRGKNIQMYTAKLDYPTSLIEGKVILRIPKLGFLHILALCSKEPKCIIEECITTGICKLMDPKK